MCHESRQEALNTRAGLAFCGHLDVPRHRALFACSSCVVNTAKAKSPGQGAWTPRVRSWLGSQLVCPGESHFTSLGLLPHWSKSGRLSNPLFGSQLVFHFLREAFPDPLSIEASSWSTSTLP